MMQFGNWLPPLIFGYELIMLDNFCGSKVVTLKIFDKQNFMNLQYVFVCFINSTWILNLFGL